MINCLINKLMESNEPTEIELMEAFDEIFSGVCNEIEATSFITLLKEKESLFKTKSMCLSCAIKSARSVMTKASAYADNFPTLEVVQLKETPEYFDISFIMDIILASNDILISKYSFPFQTMQCFNTLKAFNILSNDINENFYEDFEKTNFVYLKLNDSAPFYKYANDISRKLPFNNALNIVSKFLNPLSTKNQFIGVSTKDDVEKFANICLNIGNQNTLILNSGNELPYASIESETYVAEAWKNKIFTYVVTPELLGINRHNLKDLKAENIGHNKEAILNLFDNKEKGALYDCIVYNSALALYIVKKASSIMEGLNIAKKTIDDGLAKEKLTQIQKIYG